MTPLCVDLDGTIIRTDTTREACALLAKQSPVKFLCTLAALLSGRAAFKRGLARCVTMDAATLPYRDDVLSYLQDRNAAGDALHLVTGSDEKFAHAVADHLGMFKDVSASDGHVNLTKYAKRDALVSRFGEKQFDYVGDSSKDIPVWATARHAIVVGNADLERRARAVAQLERRFTKEPMTVAVWLRLLRVRQWVKNLLVFAPLIAAHELLNTERVLADLVAFGSFCAAASAMYIINDVLDAADDRHHAAKRDRPIASGIASVPSALFAAAVLFILSFALSSVLGGMFVAAIALYLILTLAYSLRLKRVPVVDILLLTALCLLRIEAGGIAAQIPVSPWAFVFGFWIFLSIALLKRCGELAYIRTTGGDRVVSRGYLVQHESMLRSIGAVSALASVATFTAYLFSPKASELYAQPVWLMPIIPLLLYGIARLWKRFDGATGDGDPIRFGLRDPLNYVLWAAIAVCLYLAI